MYVIILHKTLIESAAAPNAAATSVLGRKARSITVCVVQARMCVECGCGGKGGGEGQG